MSWKSRSEHFNHHVKKKPRTNGKDPIACSTDRNQALDGLNVAHTECLWLTSWGYKAKWEAFLVRQF